jgi:hypothetical protein
VHACRATDLP